MTTWPVHARIDGPIVMIGFGSIGKGTLPLIERHFAYDKSALRRHRPRGQGPRPARRARHPLHPPGRDAGELPPPADAAAHGRRRAGLLRQPVGRHLLARHHGALQRDRRALHRHRQRAVGRASISTPSLGPEARSNYALRETTLAAKRARKPGSTTAVSCCGANPGMVSWFVKQALLDVAADIGRQGRRAEDARGLGPAGATARRQGHPHRRARHPARQEPEAARRVRQHLVGRGLSLGRHAAGRARLGHA